MSAQATKSIEYWQHLEEVVSAEIEAALLKNGDARRPLITYLRELEEEARAGCGRRETIQIIASGRRLLGDASNIGSADEPFTRFVHPTP